MKSPIIADIKRKLRKIRAEYKDDPQESKARCERSVTHFWGTVARKTPVIIPDPTSEKHAIVTFLWRDDAATMVLLFLNRITDEKNLEESLLKRIPQTDIWHISYRMETNWRASYCFLPGYRTKSVIEMTGTDQVAIRKALDGGIADPRNPKQAENRARNILSVVELPDAPPQPWFKMRPETVERGNTTSFLLPDGGHVVWVYEPYHAIGESVSDAPALIIFDGDVWTSAHVLPTTLDNLIADGEIPPLYALLVESENTLSRWDELSADGGIEHFIINRLLSWARSQFPITRNPDRLIIAGQSLGGLSALWVALKRPNSIRNVIAQSSSLWQERVMEKIEQSDMAAMHIYLEVGRQEWVLLPLHQKLKCILDNKGVDYRYVEYNGGHDYVCWRGGMADGLRWITRDWRS